MTNEKKLKFYKELRKTIAKDGNSHSCLMTKEGVVIDEKLYPFKKRNRIQSKNK